MAIVNEENVINAIALIERGIDGVKNSYEFGQNPTSLTNAKLPAVMHYQSEFRSDLFGHHNVHKNSFIMQSILLVAPRQSSGGKLGFLENKAIPFLKKWRVAFQTEANVRTMLNLGLTKAYTFTGQYGAGGTLLTHNDIEYIGVVFTFELVEHN